MESGDRLLRRSFRVRPWAAHVQFSTGLHCSCLTASDCGSSSVLVRMWHIWLLGFVSLCLQSTSKLPKTVSHLVVKSSSRRAQTACIGLRCGQDWWSGFRSGTRNTVKLWLTWDSAAVGQGERPDTKTAAVGFQNRWSVKGEHRLASCMCSGLGSGTGVVGGSPFDG
jgi:hypothetical protein